MPSPEIGIGLFGLIIGVVLGGGAMYGFRRSLLHDEGFNVYTTPTIEALEVILAACKANGLEPAREITDEKTIRALMGDGHTVFNVTRSDVWEEMGWPSGAPVLRVRNPAEAAEKAMTIFKTRGFEDAEVIAPMADQTKGQMFFVKTDALACGLIGFREHVVKMGTKPPKWDYLNRPKFAKNKKKKFR